MIDRLFRKKSTALGYQERRFPQSNVNVSSPTQVPSLNDGFADIMSAWAFCTERLPRLRLDRVDGAGGQVRDGD